jgi:4-aminobutyrate aminotransferase
MNTSKCEALVARDKAVIATCSKLTYYPLVIDKIEGSVITDMDGNEFIDFLSSASSLNLGSVFPAVNEAIKEQLDKYSQYTVVYSYGQPTIEYAERLASVYPGGGSVKVAFGNCGSDANDAAIKLARAYTGRQKIVTFINGYHGSTYGSITLSACTARMAGKMGPLLPEVYKFPFYGIDLDDDFVRENCLKEIETAFAAYLPAEEVAAVIIEPIQGDAGILPAHPIFMEKLYDLCRANGILFIAEEVQQAFHRTGKWFSIEHYGIVPDAIILGKSVGAGLTLGALIGKAEIMDSLPAPAHVFTLGGNAVACAAGVAAFDHMQTEKFQQEVAENIKTLWDAAEGLKSAHPERIDFVRGIGMSMGIGIKHPDGTPDPDGTYKVLYRCYEKGLIVISLAGNVLRIQPPVNIPAELIKRGFAIISEAIDEYVEGKISDEVFKFRAGW